MSNHPRLIHATWTLQGYFICSFNDKTIFVIHPTGKRYWIKQSRNRNSSSEWLGSIFCPPRHWKPYIQQAVPLRNHWTQYPIWFNTQLGNYEIFQWQEMIKKISWPGNLQLNDYLSVNLTPLATILYSLDRDAALILFRHQQLVQMCISPRKLQNREISDDLERWVHQHVYRLPSSTTNLEREDNNMIVQTFPISQCPFIFREALSLVLNHFGHMLDETIIQQEPFYEHTYELIPLDHVVQHTTEGETCYQLDQRIIPLVQFDKDAFFWYVIQQDSVIAWKDVRLDALLQLNNSGRIVEYFSLDNGQEHHLIFSIRGIPPQFHHSWKAIIQTSMRWRNQVKKLWSQPLIRYSSPRRKIQKTRQEWLSLDSWGDFKLDTRGYLSCHFRDGTFILFHPNHQHALLITLQGNEYRIHWKHTLLFRHYFVQIHQVYRYLLLSPSQRREIQTHKEIQQHRIAMQLRSIQRNRQILQFSPPLLITSS
ncbi:hypothetical protein Gasu2_18270 [Galdieria sulphuraria]|nr:hypothetical protein Gasu2_18270 [Galdieria sulphuraria]